ncbi:MAG: hypothetical protein MPW16_07000 [Candidatus Manganitrophus sp.]|nr:MAG: hypothetical protein MPW16_07000 [Candidatus Manganitrophus sp.]
MHRLLHCLPTLRPLATMPLDPPRHLFIGRECRGDEDLLLYPSVSPRSNANRLFPERAPPRMRVR